MEIAVVTEDLVLRRSSSSDDNYVLLDIKIYDENELLVSMTDYVNNNSEDESVEKLFDDYVEYFHSDYVTSESLEQLRFKVIQGFNQMRLNDISGNSDDYIKIHVENM